MKITISLKNIVFFKKNYTKIKHHSIFLTAVHHTKKEVNYSLYLVLATIYNYYYYYYVLVCYNIAHTTHNLVLS